MSHTHTMKDTDPSFFIDADLRTIESTSEDPVTLVKGDHNSEIFTFEMDRYIDEHDLKQCNKVEIHYINIDANNSKNKNYGIYTVTDLTVDPSDNNSISFTWKVPITATTYAGALSFVVRFECTEGEEILYAWNTTPCTEVSVLDSIYNTDFIEEEYTDVIGEWYNEILSAKNQALDEIGKSGGIVVSRTEPESDDVNVWVDNSEDEVVMLLEASDCVKMANSIKGNASGEVIRLDDVSPLEHGVKAKVRGKNLLNADELVNNVFIKNQDGSFTFTKNGSARFSDFVDIDIPENSIVSVSATKIEGTADGFAFQTLNPDGSYTSIASVSPSKTFASAKVVTKPDKIRLYLGAGEVDGAYLNISDIQIEISSAATTYEPYVDPTTVTVTGCGKNLIDLSQFCNDFFRENSANIYTFEKGPNAGDRFSKKVPFNIPAGVDIYVSMDVVGYTTSYEMLFMIFTHSDGTETYPGVELTSGERSIAITKPVTHIQFYIQSSEAEDSHIMFKNFQMELGTTQSTFESYKANTYTPSSDGSVVIDSVSPNMTVFTDTAGVSIELEYNKDINKVLANLPSGPGGSITVEQEVNDSENPVSSVAVQNEFSAFSIAYDEIIKQLTVSQEEFDNDSVLIVENNKDYHAINDISSLDMRISSIGECICSVTFKIVDSGDFDIGILGCKGYIGKAPDFKNGETWELNIHNGIIASGKVVSE